MALVARKRARIAAENHGSVSEAAEFRRGSIRRVVLHNFMTYSDCWLTPGPRLNLVVGPNGSGKSTIVCALCIGLAASPKLLGRADNVKDFVRRGESRGWVEISVQEDDDGNVVRIRRTLNKVSHRLPLLFSLSLSLSLVC